MVGSLSGCWFLICLLLHNYGFAPLIINTEVCLQVTCYLEEPKWAWSEWGPPPLKTGLTLISVALDTVVRQLNIMSKVITFLHAGCSPCPAVRSALGCGPAICSWTHQGIARCCCPLQQGLAGCAFLPSAVLSVCEERCTWTSRKMARRGIDKMFSQLCTQW